MLIDTDNSNLTEEEIQVGLRMLQKLADNKDKEYTRLEACKYLRVSETKFNYIRTKGLISNGHKKAGDVRKWNKSELDNYINNNKN